ncbi:MAG: alpha/beta hydrolase [Bryobacteraceae bacterium]
MKLAGWIAIAAVCALAPLALAQQSREIEVRRDLAYGTHDGVSLIGDLYVPKASGKYPVIVAVHGGGWQGGSRTGYRYWGAYLAERGIALYAIDYRLSKPGQPSYPQAVHDVRAAVQFVKSKAVELKIDPDRVGMMGDSAGAQLAALVALAGDSPAFSTGYPSDAYANLSTKVIAVVSAYGVFDLTAQWNHDQIERSFDQISEKFIGKPPAEDRRVYFEASPISYATRSNNQVSFLLTWGTVDDIADPATQSQAFMTALKQANFFVRPVPVIGAPHFWFSDPIDDPRGHPGFVAPQVLRFLEARL